MHFRRPKPDFRGLLDVECLASLGGRNDRFRGIQHSAKRRDQLGPEGRCVSGQQQIGIPHRIEPLLAGCHDEFMHESSAPIESLSIWREIEPLNGGRVVVRQGVEMWAVESRSRMLVAATACVSASVLKYGPTVTPESEAKFTGALDQVSTTPRSRLKSAWSRPVQSCCAAA